MFFTFSATPVAASLISSTALLIYLLTTSTVPSALVISIVICVTTPAITINAKIGGKIIAITPAAIPALTGTSTISFSSLLILILVTFPLFIKSLSHFLNSSILSAFILLFSFASASFMFSMYIIASNTSPLAISSAFLASA